MPKNVKNDDKTSHNGYINCLKILSTWGLIFTLLNLIKATTAAKLDFPKNYNREVFMKDETLVHGLHSYFPYFSLPSNETHNA